ncbi:ice-structuring glycoprotein-like [Drosophila tropicalis]|uniref:ice-structuring glycoprotein-like n=1 Tax=Drosophila tropicalis TaxID=46794 RepID=UPI0035AB8CEB
MSAVGPAAAGPAGASGSAVGTAALGTAAAAAAAAAPVAAGTAAVVTAVGAPAAVCVEAAILDVERVACRVPKYLSFRVVIPLLSWKIALTSSTMGITKEKMTRALRASGVEVPPSATPPHETAKNGAVVACRQTWCNFIGWDSGHMPASTPVDTVTVSATAVPAAVSAAAVPAAAVPAAAVPTAVPAAYMSAAYRPAAALPTVLHSAMHAAASFAAPVTDSDVPFSAD